MTASGSADGCRWLANAGAWQRNGASGMAPRRCWRRSAFCTAMVLRWIGRRCWERAPEAVGCAADLCVSAAAVLAGGRNARRVTSRRWGCRSAEHPLLGAATPLADSERFLLTGRLSVTEPGWLGDHAVFGTVLVPGTGLLELGFAAARAVGATTVSQLTLVTPLVLPEDGAVRVQVQVDAPEAGEDGRRALSIYSRLEEASEGTAWTLHAQGMLSGAEATAALPEEVGLAAWPPVGGTPIELTGLYSTLQAHGFGYGPAFQGLREAWRVGDAVYGRAVLPEALSESAEAYGLHPALLDAALHVLGLVDAGVARVSDGSLLLPFEWSEVSLLATGARELRVRASVERSGEGEALAQLQLADGSGRAVARVGGAAAEGSERSANPRGGAQRGAAPVPAGLASGGVERGRAGSAPP